MVNVVKILCICLLPALVACKKTYACKCKTTIADTRPPSTIKTSSSSQPLGEKMTEQQASGACESIKFQLRDNFSQQVSSDARVSVIISCEVQ